MPKQLVIGFSVIIFLILLLLVLQRITPSSRDTKPLVAIININQSKESIEELASKIETVSQTDENRIKAEKIIQRALGTGNYAADVSVLNYQELPQSSIVMSAGLIPLGLRIAQLCSTKQDRSACKKDLTAVENKIDVAERLIKYYAILAHVPDLCVKADLGTKPHINATAIDGNTSRLNICTGAPGDIKFRAAAKNGKMVRVIESFTPGISGEAIKKAETCVLQSLLNQGCNE